MTIVEFLEARIAEDEAIAHGVQGAVDELSSEPRESWRVDRGRLYITAGISLGLHPALGEHVARHYPARVLAGCEAKRRIIEYADDATAYDMQVDSEFRVGGRDEVKEPYIGDLILRAMAAVYSDHADYDQAWA